MDGLFAADIILENKYFIINSFNMMIATYDGKLIMSNYKNKLLANSTKYESVDDEKVTGFNRTDWNAILNFLNNNVIESTCKSVT